MASTSFYTSSVWLGNLPSLDGRSKKVHKIMALEVGQKTTVQRQYVRLVKETSSGDLILSISILKISEITGIIELIFVSSLKRSFYTRKIILTAVCIFVIGLANAPMFVKENVKHSLGP